MGTKTLELNAVCASDCGSDHLRESDHRMAVEILGAHNNWYVTGIARNGEVWDP
jgi:hypothetical protein